MAGQLYEKESRELISNISHDLKTPLSSIKGYAEGILDGVASTPERQEKYLKTILNLREKFYLIKMVYVFLTIMN